MRGSQYGRKKESSLDREGLWNYALKTLGVRALSTGELRPRLARRAADSEDVAKVIASLKEYGYLDDSKFAGLVATARRDNQGLGKQRVLRELRGRRIAPAVAERAVEEVYEGADESALIDAFLQRKFRSVNLASYLKEEKNLASAFRKLRYAGFSASGSIRALRQFSSRAEEIEEAAEEDGKDAPQ